MAAADPGGPEDCQECTGDCMPYGERNRNGAEVRDAENTFRFTFGLNSEDTSMHSQSKYQQPQRISLLSSLARQQQSPARHHVGLPTIYGVYKSRC
jgi:hypothetical protein